MYVFIRSLFENTILWILLQTYKEVLFVGKPWQRVFMNMMIFCAFQENFDEWSHLTIGIEKKQAFMLKIIIWSVLTLIKNLLTQLLWSLVETKIFFFKYGPTCCLNKADLLSVGSSVRSFFSTSCLISSVRSVICNQTKSNKLKVKYCVHVCKKHVTVQ